MPNQLFYLLPTEQIAWLMSCHDQMPIWTLLSRSGAMERVEADGIESIDFQSSVNVPFQLFIGNENISQFPGSLVGQKTNAFDFRAHFAVLLTPSFLSNQGDILTQGSIATFPDKEYEDKAKAKDLLSFFSQLRKLLREFASPDLSVASRLHSGELKVWRNVLVGARVEKADLILCQHFGGSAFELHKPIRPETPKTNG
jgi:hypothetical protein